MRCAMYQVSPKVTVTVELNWQLGSKNNMQREFLQAYSLNANVNKMRTLKLQNTERSLVARIVLQVDIVPRNVLH